MTLITDASVTFLSPHGMALVINRADIVSLTQVIGNSEKLWTDTSAIG